MVSFPIGERGACEAVVFLGHGGLFAFGQCFEEVNMVRRREVEKDWGSLFYAIRDPYKRLRESPYDEERPLAVSATRLMSAAKRLGFTAKEHNWAARKLGLVLLKRSDFPYELRYDIPAMRQETFPVTEADIVEGDEDDEFFFVGWSSLPVLIGKN